MPESPLFSPRLLGLWVAAGLITFAFSLWFMLAGDDAATTGPSTFSISAIGHAGVADLLERAGVSVIRSKGESANKLGRGGLLVVAEPEVTLPSDGKVEALLRARKVLLVLPKWEGASDGRHAGWIRLAAPVALGQAERVLDLAVSKGSVVRIPDEGHWTRNQIGPMPHAAEQIQLITSDRLTPLVAGDGGILLGEIKSEGRTLWILSDPDLIANHGLALGNAPFALALFDRLRGGGPVVFDESIHGFEAVPRNPLDLVLSRRFLATALEALAACALLLWATIGRFGAPEPAPVRLAFGKQGLIRNVAQLMDHAGHQPALVRRYVEAKIRDAGRQLHVPRGLDFNESLQWLQRLSEARGGTMNGPAIRRRAMSSGGAGSLAELSRIARDIRIWKREMMNGPSGGAGDRGGDSRRGAQGGGRSG